MNHAPQQDETSQPIDLKSVFSPALEQMTQLGSQRQLPEVKNFQLNSILAGRGYFYHRTSQILSALDLSTLTDPLLDGMNALQQLDIAAIGEGEFDSLINAVPQLCDALQLGDISDQVSTGIEAITSLEPESILAGDLSSLTAAVPKLLKSVNLTELSDTVLQGLSAADSIDINKCWMVIFLH